MKFHQTTLRLNKLMPAKTTDFYMAHENHPKKSKENIQDKTAKRVLIFMLGSLGDTMVSLPCFHLIARTYPHAERVLLTKAPVSPKAPTADSVLGNSGLIHGCIRYNGMQRAGLWRKIDEIRKFKPDVVVYLMSMHRSNYALWRDLVFFRFFVGAESVVGIPAIAQHRRLRSAKPKIYEAEADRLARTLRVLGDAGTQNLLNWDLLLSQAELNAATEALSGIRNSPFIVCGPGTKMQAKDWGTDNWKELVARLSVMIPDHALVLVGAREETEETRYIESGWRGPKLNLTGALTPRETAAVLRKAHLFIGPDSGPMHLAAAAGVPCAIPFSARDHAGVWYPVGDTHKIIYHDVECKHCRLQVCSEQKKKCLTSITVDEMLAASLEAFSNGRRMRAAGA